jgi:hypothetical protein
MNIRKDIARELHRRALKKFVRKQVKLLGIDDLWQADLFELTPYAKENGGYKYVLVVIDCFSKFLWTRSLRSKNGEEVTNEMNSIFKFSNRTCKNLQTDMGKEFYNKHFKNLMKQYNINHYSTFTHLKAQMAERVIRTIKEKLWKQFTMQGTYNWTKIIDEIVDNYNNNTIHSTIGMEPNKVNKSNESFLLKSVYNQNNNKNSLKTPKFNIGDLVRISKFKKTFEKGYMPNYTTEIFKIIQVNRKFPNTYLLEDYQQQPIAGQFYEQELLKVKHPPTAYLVEKVIKRKDKKSFVKWPINIHHLVC